MHPSQELTCAAGQLEGLITAHWDDLPAQLGMDLQLLAEKLHKMAAQAAGDQPVVIITNGPVTGNAAEWIGNMLGADAFLPRFDTEEFLAQVKGATLRQVAEQQGMKATGKISDLRATIAGAAENYRPTTFGAPGLRPLSAEDLEDLREEQEEQAAELAEAEGAEA